MKYPKPSTRTPKGIPANVFQYMLSRVPDIVSDKAQRREAATRASRMYLSEEDPIEALSRVDEYYRGIQEEVGMQADMGGFYVVRQSPTLSVPKRAQAAVFNLILINNNNGHYEFGGFFREDVDLARLAR